MADRTFIPGSSWLYFKLYTGQKSADEILISHLYPLVKALQKGGKVQDFFFIRYMDPSFHLRVRFYISEAANYGAVFSIFHDMIEPCVRKGLISKVQCDTYQQELERYGNLSIEIIERIFGVDSLFQLELLQRLADNSQISDNNRWLLSFRLIDDILDAFGLDRGRKINILSSLADNYKREFGFTQHVFTKQLNDKYRLYRPQIIRSFRHPLPIEEVLSARKERLVSSARSLLEMEESGILERPIDDIICNLFHMTMNRWFHSKNRIYELVIYDFLLRYHKSAQAQFIYRK